MSIYFLSAVILASCASHCTDVDSAIQSISADSLRGHLSFIASDLLEGRDTPSPGLNIAAEYIAAQFRRAGLEPVGDDGYFQTAMIETDAPDSARFTCAVRGSDDVLEVDGSSCSLIGSQSVTLSDTSVLFLQFPLTEALPTPNGPCVIVTDMPSPPSVSPSDLQSFFTKYNAFMKTANKLGAVAVLTFDPTTETGNGIDRQSRWARLTPVPTFTLHGNQIARHFGFDGENWNPEPDSLMVDLSYTRPKRIKVPVRNVVAKLRGSDPERADEYIILTAHYDHLGLGTAVDGDNIYNGANDDGSGTVSVIEIASALARLIPQERPQRSILFMCVYGEERGLQGSRYYVQHPIVPLENTIANINLEHFGRTDDRDGPSVKRIMPTGFDYSTVIQPFIAAGEMFGVDLYRHPQNSDSFFGRSDNAAFANVGIPAHTFCAAFIFPDYHAVGDHWEYVDFDNMALLDKVVAKGLIDLANAEEPPHWNEEYRPTARYIDAWHKLHDDKSR